MMVVHSEDATVIATSIAEVRMAAAAGVVLAGGRSSRMGRSKAALEWHGSTLLYRTAALLARTVSGPVVVVGAPGQSLPELPTGVRVVSDPREGLGPMQGIAAGLSAVAQHAPAAFVCSTDLPLLHPSFVRTVLRRLAVFGVDAVLPVARGFRQPLAAAYRTALAELFATLVAQGELRLSVLPDRCVTSLLTEEELLADPELARHDPRLDSVVNVNLPADYEAARRRALAEITVVRGESRLLKAATLAEVAAAYGLSRFSAVELNGESVTPDPMLPLVAGDTLVLG